jgi:hypothetical protein
MLPSQQAQLQAQRSHSRAYSARVDTQVRVAALSAAGDARSSLFSRRASRTPPRHAHPSSAQQQQQALRPQRRPSLDNSAFRSRRGAADGDGAVSPDHALAPVVNADERPSSSPRSGGSGVSRRANRSGGVSSRAREVHTPDSSAGAHSRQRTQDDSRSPP